MTKRVTQKDFFQTSEDLLIFIDKSSESPTLSESHSSISSKTMTMKNSLAISQ
jgi:hypothetical protein